MVTDEGDGGGLQHTVSGVGLMKAVQATLTPGHKHPHRAYEPACVTPCTGCNTMCNAGISPAPFD